MRKSNILSDGPLFVGILLIPAFSQEDMEVVDNGVCKKQRPPLFST